MGIDIHCLNLLALARKRGADFSRVLTIGRQSLQLDDGELITFLRSASRPDLAGNIAAVKGDGYCEKLMKDAFGAKAVESIDAAPYENATIIHDMNFPLPGGGRFSVVLDIGCLEHVFNFPVAVDNVIRACAPGGHIVHVLPGNNWCGHGFYQFSPELFFNLYSADRGFGDTDVLLVELGRRASWYRVRSPFEIRRRINVVNRERTYVFVLTRKVTDTGSPLERPPQQSDYVEQWRSASAADRNPAADARPRRRGLLSGLARPVREGLRSIRHRLIGTRERLHAARTDMELVDPSEWL
jgi:SAM-dependent methyltransferase